MKKILSLVLVAVMIMTTAFALASCGNSNKHLVINDAKDLPKEDFGIAVKKGNDELTAKINKVVDKWVKDGTMTKYVDYYTAISKNETPNADGLVTEWDFGSATETLTVYTESGFAPFEFVKDGNVIGVDIAIMSQVAKDNNMKLVVEDVLFDTITTCVNNDEGQAAGAAGLTINAERLEAVDFSNIYYSSTLVIVSAEDKAFDEVAKLSGIKVGVQEGTAGDLIISKAKGDGYVYNDGEKDVTVVVDGKTEVKQYKQYALVLADLKAGRIDAILMDKLPAQTMLANAD